MNRSDLADLNAFVVVANQLSFRAAATQLGVTASALSHSMRQLEERHGVRLLHRTTRSVSLTDAGLRLLEQLRPAIDQISGALENLNQQRQRPFGRLRIHATHIAAAAAIAPVWARFASTYPDVHLEILMESRPIDIVASSFDAGIGRKEWAAADMIAVRVMGPMKVPLSALRIISSDGVLRARSTTLPLTAASNIALRRTKLFCHGLSGGTAGPSG